MLLLLVAIAVKQPVFNSSPKQMLNIVINDFVDSVGKGVGKGACYLSEREH